MHHFKSCILQKTPLKLDIWFQRYGQLKDCKNNKKPNDIMSFVWLYLKINISDFRLILLDHTTFCSSSSHENFQGFLSPLSINKSPSLSIRTYRAIFHLLSKTNMAVFTIPYLSTTESIGDVNFAHRYRCEIGSKVPRPFNVSLLLAVTRDYYYIRSRFFFFFSDGIF